MGNTHCCFWTCWNILSLSFCSATQLSSKTHFVQNNVNIRQPFRDTWEAVVRVPVAGYSPAHPLSSLLQPPTAALGKDTLIPRPAHCIAPGADVLASSLHRHTIGQLTVLKSQLSAWLSLSNTTMDSAGLGASWPRSPSSHVPGCSLPKLALCCSLGRVSSGIFLYIFRPAYLCSCCFPTQNNSSEDVRSHFMRMQRDSLHKACHSLPSRVCGLILSTLPACMHVSLCILSVRWSDLVRI